MTRFALPLLGWALLAAGVTETMTGREEVSTKAGQRSLFYALDEDTQVTVRLSEGADLVLSSALEVPEPPSRDEGQTWTWGIELQLQPHQGDPITQEIWLRSRRSLLENGAERIHGARSGQVLTDLRRIDLPLGELAPAGGLLTFRPLLADSSARMHLRVEQHQTPDPATLALHMQSTGLMADRASRHSPFPWTSLNEVERIRLASADTEPVGAEHLSGTTRALHRLGPIHNAPTTHPRGVALQPGQATQITLVGPCRVEVETRSLVDQSPTDLPPERLIVHGEEPELDTAIGSDENPLEATSGELISLRWLVPEESDPVSLSIRAYPSPDCLWGAPPGRASEQAISPETRRLTAWHLLPESAPLDIPLATGRSHGRMKIEARPLAPEGWSPDSEISDTLLARVHYQLVDGAERVLVEGAFDAPFHPAPMEHRVEPTTGRMSEATTIQVLHPVEATTLRLTTDAAIDLRFLVPLEESGVRAPSYALPGRWQAHNAPWLLAPYVSVAPGGSDQLVEEQRLVRFDATVRPVRRKSDPTPGAWSTRSLTPEGKNESHLISEPVRQSRRIWQGWDRTRLSPINQLEVPESGRIRVDYRVPPLSSGRPISLRCGGTTVTNRLPAAASTVYLDGLPPGVQDCQLTAPIGQYLANVPGSGRRWARRRVVRGDLHDLDLVVQVPTGGTTLYIRSYTPSGRAAPTIEAQIDDGNPRRQWGHVERVTPAVVSGRPVARNGEARMEDRASGELVPRRALYIPLGDDLQTGTHKVRVRVMHSDGPVYLRFDAGSAPEPEPDTSPRWEMDGR